MIYYKTTQHNRQILNFLFFSSIGQDKSKLQKQKSKLHITILIFVVVKLPFHNISNIFICFCSFELSCPIHKKFNFIKNVYIVLCCVVIIIII